MLKKFLCFSMTTMIMSCFVSHASDEQKVWKMTNLTLVIPGEIIEREGIARKSSTRWEVSNSKEVIRIKKKICENVLTTPFFENDQRYWLNTDLKTNSQYLKFHHDKIYWRIFKKHHLGLWFPDKYKNLYRVMGIYEDLETVDTYPMVFICLTQHLNTGRIEELFVSEPHYVSFPNFDVVDIPGRLIFEGDEEQLWLKAFAADSTKVKRNYLADIDGVTDLSILGNYFLDSDVED